MNAEFAKDLSEAIKRSETRLLAAIEKEAEQREIEIAIVMIKHDVPEPTE